MIRAILIILVLMLSAAGPAAGQSGSDSPIISEFLCNPMGELETEWIELYNPNTFPVNLAAYKIGDALGLRNISDTGMYLPPGEYIILAEDMDRFHEYYKDFTGIITSPIGWQTLNNLGGDIVRLADGDGLTVDSVCYGDGFPYNRSIERCFGAQGESYWGESFSSTGSTPGEPNTYYYPRTSSIVMTIAPDPFSPDGDGFEDETVISCDMPEADEFELVIYDIAGRKVKTFFDSGASIPGEIIWDGRGDNGRMLPVGIYIIYARVEGGGAMETKKTVVIAR